MWLVKKAVKKKSFIVQMNLKRDNLLRRLFNDTLSVESI
jgi:hypothetical protein